MTTVKVHGNASNAVKISKHKPQKKFQTGGRGNDPEMGTPDRCADPGSAFDLYRADLSGTLNNRHSRVKEIQVL